MPLSWDFWVERAPGRDSGSGRSLSGLFEVAGSPGAVEGRLLGAIDAEEGEPSPAGVVLTQWLSLAGGFGPKLSTAVWSAAVSRPTLAL